MRCEWLIAKVDFKKGFGESILQVFWVVVPSIRGSKEERIELIE